MTGSSNSSSEPTPSRWRFLRHFRLRWTSLFVLVVMTAGISLINVRGMYVLQNVKKSNFIEEWETIWWEPVIESYGWPHEYMQSFDGNGLRKRAFRSFSFSAFSVDVLIGLAIILLVVVACEVWRRRRGRYRFSILDGIVLMTVVSLSLGWWKAHEKAHATEREIMEACFAENDYRMIGGGFNSESIAPGWLRRLTIYPMLMDYNRVVFADLTFESMLDADYFQRFRELVYLREVDCHFKLDEKVIEALATLPSLETVGIVYTAADKNEEDASMIKLLNRLAVVPELQEEGRRSYRSPWFLKEGSSLPCTAPNNLGIGLLKSLPSVTELKLGGRLPSPCWVTQGNLTVIAGLDQLEVLTIRSDNLLIENLAPLDDSHSLEEIHLEIVATEEELKAYQEARPHLKITWRGAQSKASVEALRTKKLAEGE